MNNRSEEISRILKKTKILRLLIHFLFPAAIVLVAFLREMGGNGGSIQDTSQLQPEYLPYLLLATGVIEILTALYITRKRPNFILKNLAKSPQPKLKGWVGANASENERRSISLLIIISAFYASCSVFGIMIVIMGHDLNWIFLFVAMTVLGFFLYTPNREFFERLYDCFDELEGKSSV